jgi:hypothetical protein
MQAMRIIEARDHIAQAAYAAMRRVEAEAALRRWSRTPPERVSRRSAAAPHGGHGAQTGATTRLRDDDLTVSALAGAPVAPVGPRRSWT